MRIYVVRFFINCFRVPNKSFWFLQTCRHYICTIDQKCFWKFHNPIHNIILFWCFPMCTFIGFWFSRVAYALKFNKLSYNCTDKLSNSQSLSKNVHEKTLYVYNEAVLKNLIRLLSFKNIVIIYIPNELYEKLRMLWYDAKTKCFIFRHIALE